MLIQLITMLSFLLSKISYLTNLFHLKKIATSFIKMAEKVIPFVVGNR